MPYIEALSKRDEVLKVYVIVAEIISEERKAMGWTSKYENYKNEKLRIIVKPGDPQCHALYDANTDQSYHFYSGIRGFENVYQYFLLGLKYRLKRGLITESPYTFAFGKSNGKPLWLHKLRFLLQDRKYIKDIQTVFAIGEKAVNYYQFLSKDWQVNPFVYCTEKQNVNNERGSSSKMKFLFVGSLSARKNPLLLAKAAECLNVTTDFTVDFIGNGEKVIELENYIKAHQISNIHLKGHRTIEQIPEEMAQYDVLVLPSLYDGWGAVVNEALSLGLFVICSDQCGAKILIQNKKNGIVFKSGSKESLSKALQWCVDNKNFITQQNVNIQQWSNRSLSGSAVAQYFISAIKNSYKINEPWKNPIDE